MKYDWKTKLADCYHKTVLGQEMELRVCVECLLGFEAREDLTDYCQICGHGGAVVRWKNISGESGFWERVAEETARLEEERIAKHENLVRLELILVERDI